MKRYKFLAALLFAAIFGAGFTACSDSDDDKKDEGGTETPTEEGVVEVFNDLLYFQNSIIEIDEEGNFMSRSCGEVLYDDEPHHIYVGVESLAEAEQMFRQWLAPDVTVTPTPNGLSAALTDEEGKAQGTVNFAAATGSGEVAEVTADADLKYFSKLTFLLNSAWPLNDDEKKFYLGDVITYAPGSSIHSDLYEEDRSLKWLCVRESGKGMKPMFVTITNRKYTGGSKDMYPDWNDIRTSDYCPCESKAQSIVKEIQSDWEYWQTRFKEHGIPIEGNASYWIDKTHLNWSRFYDAIDIPSGKVYGYRNNEKELRFLLKIDWMDDASLFSSLVGTAGSKGFANEDYNCLFDGVNSSKWCTAWKTDGVWFVEFQSNAPLKATGYKVTTAGDIEEYSSRNPKAWRLLGRNDEEDEWEEIAKETNAGMPAVNGKTKTFSIGTPRNYMYYRWEISENSGGGDHMQVSCFSLVL